MNNLEFIGALVDYFTKKAEEHPAPPMKIGLPGFAYPDRQTTIVVNCVLGRHYDPMRPKLIVSCRQ